MLPILLPQMVLLSKTLCQVGRGWPFSDGLGDVSIGLGLRKWVMFSFILLVSRMASGRELLLGPFTDPVFDQAYPLVEGRQI
jgi:hypothetical protein